MATSDVARREWLIYFSQNLFDRELLPSPEQIVIDYIRQGFPEIEKSGKLISKAAIANTWRDLVDFTSKTFVYSHEDFVDHLKFSEDVNRLVHRVVRNEDVPLFGSSLESGTLATIESLRSRRPFYRDAEDDDRRRKIYRISAFYLVIIVYTEAGFENQCIQRFWTEIGIEHTEDRIRYAFCQVGTTAIQRAFVSSCNHNVLPDERAVWPGIYFDRLHAFYTTYIDLFLTNDRHYNSCTRKFRSKRYCRHLTGKCRRHSKLRA